MKSLPINLVRYSLKRYTYKNNVRLLSSNLIQSPYNDENEKKVNIFIRKITELNDWYVKFTGLDEIKRLQDKVILTQEKLEKAQEERRETGQILVDIRKKSNELQEALHSTKRWENVQKYLDLTKQESEVFKLEKELTAKFDMLDKAEREIFTALSNAVRDSHEKEKAQSEYTKYWGIILSIISTIVGAVVSTIISSIRNHQIVSGINRGVEEKFEKISGVIDQNKTGHMQGVISQIRNENHQILEIITEKLQDTQKKLSTLITNSTPRNLLYVQEVEDEDKLINVDVFLNTQYELLQEHQNEIKQILSEPKIIVTSLNWRLLGGVILLGYIIGKIV